MGADSSFMHIRAAAIGDLPDVLRLNRQYEHFLSPLSLERLHDLHVAAACHRVAIADGRVVAFLIALREGADYDSPNYRWFAERRARFLYIDRVVVGADVQGQGLGLRLYEDLFDLARRMQVDRVTCEFDTDPPNPGSARFHQKLGFVEVGRQTIRGGSKSVSLQEWCLTAAG